MTLWSRLLVWTGLKRDWFKGWSLEHDRSEWRRGVDQGTVNWDVMKRRDEWDRMHRGES